MTRSEIFRAAHALARATRQAGDDYRTTFGACLSLVLRIARATGARASLVERVALWSKAGHFRLYINYRPQNRRFRQGADYVDLTTGRYVATHQHSGATTRRRVEAFREDYLGLAA